MVNIWLRAIVILLGQYTKKAIRRSDEMAKNFNTERTENFA